MSGLTTEQALEDGWAEALHPDERPAVLAAWHQSLLDGRDFRMEHRYVRPDGSEVWVESQANAMLDDAGRTTGWVGTVIDVTDRRAADAKTRAGTPRGRSGGAAPDGVDVVGAGCGAARRDPHGGLGQPGGGPAARRAVR